VKPVLAILLGPFSIAGPAEPEPRAVKPAALKVGTRLTHVSAARELSDGRIVVTNQAPPSVLLIDPATGAVSPVGEAGGGEQRYARPGGLYSGPAGATWLIDRGQTRLFTISPTGHLQGSRSIARRGFSSSSDADRDLQQVDARGLVYFEEGQNRFAQLGTAAPDVSLMRFDAEAQKGEMIAQIRKPEARSVPGGDNVVYSREVIGSPADGWGVAPDGGVAIVRAEPYRVEWHAPGGKVVRGPVVAFTPVPMTDADKERYKAMGRGRGPSIGRVGEARADGSRLEMMFAATKPPFAPENVVVSPAGQVWVQRTTAADVTDVVYDVFDSSGKRVDRVKLPEGSRVVGFGSSSILVRFKDAAGQCELRKYGWR
jgi:streptogramin lyase